jgi:hypothetical protein
MGFLSGLTLVTLCAAHAVRAALAAAAAPSSAAEIARRFKRAKADRTTDLLATLAALGRPGAGYRQIAVIFPGATHFCTSQKMNVNLCFWPHVRSSDR